MNFVRLFCLTCFVATASSTFVTAQQPKTPNVVLILADDLGWSDLGCYGADLHDTPNLDRLAQSGVRFTDAYAASICSPTRAALMTGKHYARLQMTIWREGSMKPPKDRKLIPPVSVSDLPYQETTLAEVFQQAGYRTALVGKWHLGDGNYYPETQGFDINIGGTHWGAPHTYFWPYRGQGRFEGEFRYVPHLEGGKPGEYLTDRLTDEALKIIDGADESPFFLYLAHHAPHSPVEAPENLVKHYAQKIKPEMNHQNPKYAAMVHSLDQSVGRIINRIDERGLSDRTIVVFVSDNGGHIGQHAGQRVTNNTPLRSGKGSLYEGGVRVPLIIRSPGVKSEGVVCHEPVFVADLFPTITELAGVKSAPTGNPAPEIDGISLVSLLKQPDSHLKRTALYFHYPHYYPTTTPVSAIREGDWKLLQYYEDQHVELYNLKNDRGEAQDLAKTEPDRVKELQAHLTTWMKSINARMPTPNPDFR